MLLQAEQFHQGGGSDAEDCIRRFGREQFADFRLSFLFFAIGNLGSIDRLQMSRENRASGRVCRRCGLGCFGICCWKCWQELPAGLRGCFDGAKTTGAKVEATKAILDFIQRHPKEA